MAEQASIPLPVRFNALKHHRHYIIQQLESASREKVLELIDPLCHNQIDIYTGSMDPGTIGHAIISILTSKGVYPQAQFKSWLAERKGFFTVPIEDGSEWVLLLNQDPDRYIHIHPARTGPFTCRFKGSTLKTAYLLKTIFGNDQNLLTLEKVNQVRRQIDLSPIKKLEQNKGIIRCYNKFFDTNKR